METVGQVAARSAAGGQHGNTQAKQAQGEEGDAGSHRFLQEKRFLLDNSSSFPISDSPSTPEADEKATPRSPAVPLSGCSNAPLVLP